MMSRDFHEKVALSLTGCQLIEQALKLYISEALLLAKKSIGARMPFNMSGSDYEELPLGHLINIFCKLCNNATLVSDLRRFKDERNFLSHKAITSCLDFNGELIESEIEAMLPRLKNIENSANRLMQEIHEEVSKISVQLDFDDSLGARGV